MLIGHTNSFTSSRDHLLPDTESLLEDDAADNPEEILYAASFDELASHHIQYDTIIWVSISLLLILAWGVGIIMLLCLPIRRYVLRKDISSRKLYVTPTEIVYKVSRPSLIPFWGVTTFEKYVPLSQVIDIIVEQGCLQSVYGLQTLRIESIAHGKAAPVDELQIQGVANPGILMKVIVTEATKAIQDAGKGWKLSTISGAGESVSTMTSLTKGPPVFKSPSKSWKMAGSPRHAPVERRGMVPGQLLLNKLDEVSKSVKKIELLIEKSHASSEGS